MVYQSLKRSLHHLNKEVALLEASLLDLVEQDQQQQLTHPKSIPGVGTKTALFLIVITMVLANLKPLVNSVLMWV
tara:strand:- start:225 stop:449 length:225 start_codon:yes stop_codon:yes gene_type:complete